MEWTKFLRCTFCSLPAGHCSFTKTDPPSFLILEMLSTEVMERWQGKNNRTQFLTNWLQPQMAAGGGILTLFLNVIYVFKSDFFSCCDMRICSWSSLNWLYKHLIFWCINPKAFLDLNLMFRVEVITTCTGIRLEFMKAIHNQNKDVKNRIVCYEVMK